MKKAVSQVNLDLAGFRYPLEQMNYQWIWWPPNKPAFDVFDEEKPDMILTAGEETAAVIKCLAERPCPSINITNKLLTWKNGRGDPTGHPLPPLVDPSVYYPVEPSDDLKCDVSFIGKVNTVMLCLCESLGRYNVKISGPEHWPVFQYLGDLTPTQARTLYSSALLCYADSVEEALRITACGAVFITTDQAAKAIWENDEALILDYEEEVIDVIDNFVVNPHLLEGMAQACHAAAIPEHTYGNFLEKIIHENREEG